MRIEVDQSGRIEYTRTKTVFAFSNKTNFSISISAKVKRDAFAILRERHTVRSCKVRLFAACLVILLKDVFPKANQIVVDVEFESWDRDIKLMIGNISRKLGIKIDLNDIDFIFVGKKSRAHEVAVNVFRGERDPDREIGLEELLAGLK